VPQLEQSNCTVWTRYSNTGAKRSI
jgi:hypothetical protein